MWASCLGYYDIVCLLVEAGADLKLATKDKHGWHAISLASRRNHYKIVKYLTGIDNSIVEVCDERGYNLLHIAVDLNDKTQLATSLASLANSLLSYCEEKKKDFKINFLNAYNKEGMTPLHIAASKGLLNHVKLLVQLGGDIEGRSKSNIYPGEKATPLFFAAIYGHDDVVRYLLSVNEEGARFNETVHIQATGGRRGFKITNPFREAAYRGHRQVLMALLQHPKIFSHDPKKPLLTEKSFHSLQVKNLGDLSIWLKSILVGLTHEGSDVVVEDQFIEMIKSVKASREAQMLYDCFISKYKTNESPYTMISPHSQSPDSQFNQKWNMFKGEYITAGSESIDTDSADSGIQFFWGKRGHERWYKLWNGFFKGAVESHCVSYTIDIPYTSHRAFLALFLLIDRDADTEIPRTRENNKGAYSIFDIDFVEASVLHAWKKYGFWYHIRDLLLFLSYLVLSSYTNYTFNVISSDDHSTYKNAGLILVKVELALTAFFSYRWIFIHLPKITQTLSKHAHLFRYVTNVGIWVEISWLGWYSLTFAGSIIRLRRGVETDLSSYLMAIATMLQYMLVITYFRPFRAFGPLVCLLIMIMIMIISY